MTRHETTEAMLMAMRDRSISFTDLAERLGRPRVWAAAAAHGQHPFSADEAALLIEWLELPAQAAHALQAVPTRGALESSVPVDPTIYRLYEVLQVYGPALKALIHEDFGDGIMSAINFREDLERVPDPAGDRVRITLDGKFLPYQWD